MNSHPNRSRSLLISSALSLAALTGHAAAAPAFHILGSQQDQFYPDCLSGNGQRIIGEYFNHLTGRFESVYLDWRTTLSPTPLQPGAHLSPKACSHDGNVIIGTAFTTMTQPFRYSGGILSYIAPPAGANYASANALSADGTSLVGQSFANGTNYTAAKWTTTAGWSFLPPLTTATCRDSVALAISGDGGVIAGSAQHCHNPDTELDSETVKWNPALAALGWYPEIFGTQTEAISADGSTVVGRRVIAAGSDYFAPKVYEPCRWTRTGIQTLAPGLLLGYGSAHDVNADGSVIVGIYDHYAFIWNASTGLVNLNSLAANLVGSLDGWTLTDAIAVSDDGTVILGKAQKGGSETAFVLDLGAPCIADFNRDNLVDFFDYLDFVQAFAAANLTADINHDQILDFFDYLDFVQQFAAGC